MKTYKKGELALKILFAISVGAAIPAILVVPNIAQVILPALRKWAKKLEARPQAVQKSLQALKRSKLISVEEKDGEITFTLTKDGEKRIVKGKVDMIVIPVAKKWDKKWRMVIFDIPEEQRKARDALRQKLTELSFFQLQKSCFAHPYECHDQIDFVAEFFGVSEHVSYLVAESLDVDRNLRKHFNLLGR